MQMLPQNSNAVAAAEAPTQLWTNTSGYVASIFNAAAVTPAHLWENDSGCVAIFNGRGSSASVALAASWLLLHWRDYGKILAVSIFYGRSSEGGRQRGASAI